jgi:uncharacterized membrane protein YfcA
MAPSPEALVVLACWFLGGLPWGAVGIGGAIVFTVLYSVFAGFGVVTFASTRVAVMTQAGVLAMTGAQTIALGRRPETNWAFCLFVGLIFVPCDVFGAHLLFIHADAGHGDELHRALGVFLLFTCAVLAALELRNEQPAVVAFDMGLAKNRMAAAIFAVVGGLCAGFFSVPIVAFTLFPMLAGMGKEEWRCSVSPFYFVSTLGKVGYLFETHRLKPEDSGAYAAGIFGALGGALTGNAIAPLVSQKHFRHSLLLFMTVGAVSLCAHGTTYASELNQATICAAGAAVLAMAYSSRKSEYGAGYARID